MIVTSLSLEGLAVIDIEPHADDRGFLARTFCVDELREHGLAMQIVQSSTALTHHQDTVRGLHYQRAPHAEIKLIRCTAGAAFVVAVDLRASSPTRLRWEAVSLSAENRRQLYVPEGFAQGYQALADGTELDYRMSHRYVPGAAAGVMWNDPAVGIEWPRPATRLSERDRSWPSVS